MAHSRWLHASEEEKLELCRIMHRYEDFLNAPHGSRMPLDGDTMVVNNATKQAVRTRARDEFMARFPRHKGKDMDRFK